jgi:hypothetical protein
MRKWEADCANFFGRRSEFETRNPKSEQYRMTEIRASERIQKEPGTSAFLKTPRGCRHTKVRFISTPQTPPETINFPQATGATRLAGNRFRGPFPRNRETTNKENNRRFLWSDEDKDTTRLAGRFFGHPLKEHAHGRCGFPGAMGL